MTANRIIVGLAVLALCMCFTDAKRVVMPWMCLERCGENVESDLEGILNLGPSVFPVVSIEAFDLTWGATLVDCGYSRVGPKLVNAGIKVQPMITTANIDIIRELWQDIPGFIERAMSVARCNKAWISGFNIDFEPETGDPPKENDARNFAAFVDQFAKALHKEGFNLTVDIASWCALFDDGLLAATAVDRFITMSTYAVGLDDFKYIVKVKYNQYYGSKLGVGLCTGTQLSAEAIKNRLDYVLLFDDIDYVGIWDTPIPSEWTPVLKSFVNGP